MKMHTHFTWTSCYHDLLNANNDMIVATVHGDNYDNRNLSVRKRPHKMAISMISRRGAAVTKYRYYKLKESKGLYNRNLKP